MRPYEPGEDVSNVSISDQDLENGSPKLGDMIARNPKNHKDEWLVAEKYFKDNFEPADPIKHVYWGAGESDCPKDIKAPNGELHTLRCKLCGQDSPRDPNCSPRTSP